jgi:sRNA-binding carbon storage regulator CsrA
LLVLTRKEADKVEIIVPPGDETQVIKVIVTEIGDGRIKLGFSARRDIEIWRTEVDRSG